MKDNIVKTLYIIGGKRKTDYFHKKEWNWFETGFIVRVNPETWSAEICVQYITPPEVCAADKDPSILFKAGTVQGGKLYVCTQTEVLIYELPNFKRVGYLSLPCFNDLHHVCPTAEGNLLVANSGLDMVVETTPGGTVLREWNVLGNEPWERFSKDVDYRQIITTKPHKSHPNYVWQVDREIWVTRFEQRDAICLTQPARRIEIGIERPHDGIVRGDFVYYTTVDGHIVIASLKSGYIQKVVNLNGITDAHNTALGWCRGLKVLDEAHIVVGFTRLRPTKWRENIHWIKRHLGKHAGTLPTRIALYDLQRQALCWEYSMEELGMGAIFSIHTIDD
jgi:hypothetical protein